MCFFAIAVENVSTKHGSVCRYCLILSKKKVFFDFQVITTCF